MFNNIKLYNTQILNDARTYICISVTLIESFRSVSKINLLVQVTPTENVRKIALDHKANVCFCFFII